MITKKHNELNGYENPQEKNVCSSSEYYWKMDSYVQMGESIVPIHYLVDDKGQVQLITMGTVNWALTAT